MRVEALRLPNGAALGKVLTADALGNAAWTDGVAGPQGPAGDTGPQGPQGIQGVGAGMKILTGYGAPPASVGVKGDWWLDRQTNTLYGPKDTYPTTPGQLIPNPSLETDLTGWASSSSSPVGSRIFVREATWADHGGWSLHSLITRTAATNVTAQPVADGVAGVPVDPLKKYSVQVKQKLRRATSPDTTAGVSMRMAYFDAAGALVLSGPVLGNLTGAAGDVLTHTHENLTPHASAAFARPSLYASLVANAAGSFWEADIDSWVMFEGATLPISWPTTGVDLNTPPARFMMSLTTVVASAFTSGSFSKVPFDAQPETAVGVTPDLANDSVTIGAAQAGVWMLTGSCMQGTNPAAGNTLSLRVYVNGAVPAGGGLLSETVAAAARNRMAGSTVLTLAAGDVVDLRYFQNSGSAVSADGVVTPLPPTYLRGVRLGAS